MLIRESWLRFALPAGVAPAAGPVSGVPEMGAQLGGSSGTGFGHFFCPFSASHKSERVTRRDERLLGKAHFYGVACLLSLGAGVSCAEAPGCSSPVLLSVQGLEVRRKPD